MGRTAKVAISLPEELLSVVEKTRQVRGESRSQFFRRAAEALVARECEAELDRQYIEAYRRMPEQIDEGLLRAGLEVMAAEPWDEEDDW